MNIKKHIKKLFALTLASATMLGAVAANTFAGTNDCGDTGVLSDSQSWDLSDWFDDNDVEDITINIINTIKPHKPFSPEEPTDSIPEETTPITEPVEEPTQPKKIGSVEAHYDTSKLETDTYTITYDKETGNSVIHDNDTPSGGYFTYAHFGQTGDHTNLILLFIMLCASASIIAAFFYKKFTKKKN